MVSEKSLIAKITWRLMPFLGLLYLIAYIDRQNVSYAKLQMVDAPGLKRICLWLGASLFFVGYFLFEVQAIVSQPLWCTGLVLPHHGDLGPHYHCARLHPEPDDVLHPALLLGVAEAGFFPACCIC